MDQLLFTANIEDQQDLCNFLRSSLITYFLKRCQFKKEAGQRPFKMLRVILSLKLCYEGVVFVLRIIEMVGF